VTKGYVIGYVLLPILSILALFAAIKNGIVPSMLFSSMVMLYAIFSMMIFMIRFHSHVVESYKIKEQHKHALENINHTPKA